MGNKKKITPAKGERRSRAIKAQLEGKTTACPPHKNIVIQTSRNGKNFKECNACGAFLGWC